jgi:cell division protein FtsZ
VQEAANVIYSAVSEEANIIFGAVLDDRLHGEVLITVIATGFDMISQHQSSQHRSATNTPPMTTRVAPDLQRQQQQGGGANATNNEYKKIASDILDIPEFLKPRK